MCDEMFVLCGGDSRLRLSALSVRLSAVEAQIVEAKFQFYSIRIVRNVRKSLEFEDCLRLIASFFLVYLLYINLYYN